MILSRQKFAHDPQTLENLWGLDHGPVILRGSEDGSGARVLTVHNDAMFCHIMLSNLNVHVQWYTLHTVIYIIHVLYNIHANISRNQLEPILS